MTAHLLARDHATRNVDCCSITCAQGSYHRAVSYVWSCAQDPTASLETLLKALPDGSAPKATYVKGDRVVVIAGDLNTLEGELGNQSDWGPCQKQCRLLSCTRHVV